MSRDVYITPRNPGVQTKPRGIGTGRVWTRPTIPSYQFGTGDSLGVAHPSDINATARKPSQTQLTVAALGDVLRIPYGTVLVGPQVLRPIVAPSNHLLFPLILGRGEITAVDAVYGTNGVALSSNVTKTWYMGTPSQSVNAALQAAWAAHSITYADTLNDIAWGVLDVLPRPDPYAEITNLLILLRGRKIYDPRDVIDLTCTMSTGTSYLYRRVMDDAYVIPSGANLEYDFYLDPSSPSSIHQGGFDIKITTSPNSASAGGVVDQFGNAIHLPQITVRDKWHYRKCALTAIVGKTTNSFEIVNEANTAGTYKTLYRNVRITDSSGATLKTIWASGSLDANTTASSLNAASISCSVVTAGTRFSGNPALILADWLSSSAFGRGESVDYTTVVTPANRNDEILGGLRRREIGLVIEQVATLDQWEETLRAYAGVWIVRDNGVVKFVQDAPSASVYTFTNASGSANYLLDSLIIEEPSRTDVPTVVLMSYTDTSQVPWADGFHQEAASGAGSTIPWRETNVSMPGIQDPAYAKREAIRQLNEHLGSDVNASLTATDQAIQIVKSDVVSVTDGAGFTAKDFRVASIMPADAGLWDIKLKEYNAAVYSDAVVTTSPPNTDLPSPFAPPTPTGLTLSEIISQAQTGLWQSTIKAVWDDMADVYPFVAAYRVEVKQGSTLSDSGSPTNIETSWVSKPLAENLSYTVKVWIVSTTGHTSATPASGSITNNGRIGSIPTTPTSLSVRSNSDGVEFQIGPASDIDLTSHELRYAANYGAVNDAASLRSQWSSATLIARIPMPLLVYGTNKLPSGDWRVYCKGRDSIRNGTYPYGQESYTPFAIDLQGVYGPTITEHGQFVGTANTTVFDPWIISAANRYTSILQASATATQVQSWEVGGSAVVIAKAACGGITLTDPSIHTTVADGVFLQLNTTHASGGDAFTRWSIMNDAYVIQSGDYLEYEYLVPSGYTTPVASAGVGGFDIDLTTSPNNLRSAGVVDAGGIGVAVPVPGVYDVWQARKCSLTAVVGKTTSSFNLCVEHDPGASQDYRVRYRNIRITDGSTTTRKAIWPTVSSTYLPDVNVISASALSSAQNCYSMRGYAARYNVRFLGVSGSGGSFASHADASVLTWGNGTTDSPLTVEAWIRVQDAASAFQAIIGNGSATANTGDWLLRVTSAGKIRLNLIDQSAGATIYLETTNQVVFDNTWVHVAVVYTGTAWTSAAIYIDGVSVSTTNTTGGGYVAMEDTNHPLVMGNMYNAASYNNPLFGNIYGVRIWNVARTATQIVEFKDNEIRAAPNLIFNADFDRTAFASIYDTTENALDLSNNGALETNYSARPFNGMLVRRYNNAGVEKAWSFDWSISGVTA